MIAICARRVWRIGAVVAAATIVFIGAGMVPDQPIEDKHMILIDDLRSDDQRTRNRAVDSILQQRTATIEQLLPLIDPSNSERVSVESHAAAAYLLGELRAVEAVPMLCRALADGPQQLYNTDKSRYDYPVTRALFKIGRPAVPALIENIEHSDDVVLRKRTLRLLNQILGGKRRLLELLERLNQLTEDREVSRRIRESDSWAEGSFKEDKEPLF